MLGPAPALEHIKRLLSIQDQQKQLTTPSATGFSAIMRHCPLCSDLPQPVTFRALQNLEHQTHACSKSHTYPTPVWDPTSLIQAGSHFQ